MFLKASKNYYTIGISSSIAGSAPPYFAICKIASKVGKLYNVCVNWEDPPKSKFSE